MTGKIELYDVHYYLPDEEDEFNEFECAECKHNEFKVAQVVDQDGAPNGVFVLMCTCCNSVYELE